LTNGGPAIHREWWFTRLTLFIWAWMLVGPALEDRSRRLTIDGVFATVVVSMIVAIFFSRL